MLQQFKAKYEIKSQLLGAGSDMAKEGSILNRRIVWEREGISLEADPRHAKEVIMSLGLADASCAPTPATVEQRAKGKREEGEDAEADAHADGGDTAELGPEDGTRYRAITARLNYLAHDRPDIRYATMRLCSRMSAPTVGDMTRLKRVVRYLLAVPRVCQKFQWQDAGSEIHVCTDSDWAGDKTTRRSVSGGALYLGRHLVKTWCKQQSVVATSSAEAELYAATRGASEGLGAKSFLADFGWDRCVTLHIDSSSALSIINRVGLSKLKHIEIQHLWVQELIRDRRIKTAKIAGDSNTADLMTKALSSDRIHFLLQEMGAKCGGYHTQP